MSKLEINKGDQFIIAIDTSGSMSSTDTADGTSRLKFSMETIKTFVREAEKLDPDGVSIYTFDHVLKTFPDALSGKIDSILASIVMGASTMTHLAITRAFEEHLAKKNEQTFLMIFTDGEPNDQKAVIDSIVNITKKVADPLEFRIAFITVGKRSAALQAFLTDLDDNLKTKYGALHDIVDVKEIGEVDFIGSLAGALTD